MKTFAIPLAAVAAMTLAVALLPGDEKPAPIATAKPSREELEAKFRETLTDATLAGKWRLVTEDGLGEERDERYTIRGVSRAGDLWFIRARIEYGDRDLTLPVPVRVGWAGDTPVISVTDAGIPGIGTYTARVMIYNDLYTGTWFGHGHSGFLSGRIVHSPKKESSEGDAESGR